MRVEVTTWSLETTKPSQLRASPKPSGSAEMRRAVRPSPELGRFLYTAAGGNWYWIDRLAWTYEQWLARLSHPRVETWVVYLDETPAAYCELDGIREGDVEIAYLGVLAAFMGQRLGGWLLTEAIRRAWAMGARRVWVHTCTLDAPHALANYQARGMRVFEERVETLELPDVSPGSWPARESTVPMPRCCDQAVEGREPCRRLKSASRSSVTTCRTRGRRCSTTWAL